MACLETDSSELAAVAATAGAAACAVEACACGETTSLWLRDWIPMQAILTAVVAFGLEVKSLRIWKFDATVFILLKAGVGMWAA